MKSLERNLSNFSNYYRLLGLGFGLLGIIFLNLDYLRAQSRESFTIDVSVPPIQRISVQKAKSFPFISGSDFDRGYVEDRGAVTMLISSNVPWRAVANVPKANLYVSPGKFKSVDSMQWRISSNAFRSFSLGPIVVSEGSGGVKDHKIVIDYRLKLGWDNTPPGRWEFEPEYRIEPNF